MRFGPSPYDGPVGAAQRQRKINSWRAEQDSSKLSARNEDGKIVLCEVFAYPDGYQIGTGNRQGIWFDTGPAYHLFNKLTQQSIITVVTALDVQWPTNRNRSLTLPHRKGRRAAQKFFCIHQHIQIFTCLLFQVLHRCLFLTSISTNYRDVNVCHFTSQ